jgi:hypothetical protein
MDGYLVSIARNGRLHPPGHTYMDGMYVQIYRNIECMVHILCQRFLDRVVKALRAPHRSGVRIPAGKNFRLWIKKSPSLAWPGFRGFLTGIAGWLPLTEKIVGSVSTPVKVIFLVHILCLDGVIVAFIFLQLK